MVSSLFSGRPENGLATFNYDDIISGTGIVVFYGGLAGSAGTGYLSSTTFYANPNTTTGSFGAGDGFTGSYTTLFDIDFDVVMNKQVILRGLAIMNVPVSSSREMYLKATAKVRKWDGSTETELDSGASIEQLTTAAVTSYWMLAPVVDISQAIIRNGETLRVTIEIAYKKINAGDSGNVGFAHDPKNRTTNWDATGAVPSQLVIPIPTRIIM